MNGYICSMSEVASRELRNDTAGLLRRVQAGEDITVTVNGKAVARLSALQPTRRRWLSRDQLVRRLDRTQADPALRQELAELVGDTTDDLDPLP
jgi:prevent-host-death family protein